MKYSKITIQLLLLAVAALTANFAFAGKKAKTSVERVTSWSCWAQAATRYHVNASLLYAIARVESGNHPYVVSRNRNGSYDIGLMQINSWWLPRLKKYGITAQKLRDDPCLNLKVGAWILAKTIRRYGLNWQGLGAYNASTDWKRARYAQKVVRELQQIRDE